MSALELAVMALALVGLVHVLVESVIGRPWRWALAFVLPLSIGGHLVYCPRCIAFWAGAAILGARLAGLPAIYLFPLSAVGIARIVWGLLPGEDATTGDLESAQSLAGQRDEPPRDGSYRPPMPEVPLPELDPPARRARWSDEELAELEQAQASRRRRTGRGDPP